MTVAILVMAIALILQSCMLVMITISQRTAERKARETAWDIDKIKRDILDMKVNAMDFLEAISGFKILEKNQNTEEENGSDGTA